MAVSTSDEHRLGDLPRVIRHEGRGTQRVGSKTSTLVDISFTWQGSWLPTETKKPPLAGAASLVVES
jgi:hypothetical protein